MVASIEIQELIRYIAQAYYNKKQYPIGKTTLLKVIYKTKRLLPENNFLAQQLPYYWYRFGPYSPVVEGVLDSMASNGILATPSAKYLPTKPVKLCDHNDEFSDAKTHINRIIDDPTSNTSEAVMDDVYFNYAPCGFYNSFRGQFIGKLPNFYNDPYTRFSPDDLKLTLYNSIGGLPNKSLFSDFKHSFLDFVDLVSEIFSSKSPKQFSDKITLISNNIFNTFADGIRILYHDKYYDDKVEYWKSEFFYSKKTMDGEIVGFFNNSKTNIEKTNYLTLDELIRNILKIKEENRLVKVSFFPPISNEELHDGLIDESIISSLDENGLKQLLCRFKDSRKAIVHSMEKKKREVMNYKIVS